MKSATKCTACNNRRAPTGYKRCKPCRVHIRSLAVARGRRRRRIQQCPRDGRPVKPGRAMCIGCLAYYAGRAIEQQELRRIDGRCPKCGRAPKPDRVHCAPCLRASAEREKRRPRKRDWWRKGDMTKQRARIAACKARWRAAGRCIACGKGAQRNPAGGFRSMCTRHLKLASAAKQRRRRIDVRSR